MHRLTFVHELYHQLYHQRNMDLNVPSTYIKVVSLCVAIMLIETLSKLLRRLGGGGDGCVGVGRDRLLLARNLEH